MGRRLGSLNKSTIEKMNAHKPKGGVYNVKLERQIEGTSINRKSGTGFVNWGIRNNYCDLLLDLYQNSPTHAACINFGVASIVGDGIDYEQSNFDGNEIVPNAYQGWDELIRNISKDYMLYGSYAIQCILNKDGKTMSYYHIPLSKVRWSEYSDEGTIDSFWIASDWTMIGQYPPIEVPAFDMRPDTKIEKGKAYLYVYRPYSPQQTYYTAPLYSAGIKAIQSEISAIKFDERTTQNNFVPSGMLIMNEVEDDQERRAVISNITNMFTSAENANQLLISFRNNPEQSSPEFIPFQANTGNVNLYDSLSQRAVNRILSAHQINDPHLVGLPQLGASGFNSEGNMLETAYNVYNKVIGNYNRQCVIKTFNTMLSLNGIDTQIVMKPIRFNDITTNNISSDVKDSDDIDAKDYDENKIEEKQEN